MSKAWTPLPPRTRSYRPRPDIRDLLSPDLGALGTPTPRPSPTPTATPRPTPTPRAGDDHEWRGSLSWDDHRDDERFWLSGHVHVEVTWSGDEELGISVKDDSGRTVARESEDEHIYFELDVRPGWYRFTVGQWADSWTEYRVRIEHPT